MIHNIFIKIRNIKNKKQIYDVVINAATDL